MSCPADEELQAGLCYPKCREGYTGMGPICWLQRCRICLYEAELLSRRRSGSSTPPSPPQPVTAPVVSPVTAAAFEAGLSMPKGIPVWIVMGILVLLVIVLAVLLILKKCPPAPSYSAIRTVSINFTLPGKLKCGRYDDRRCWRIVVPLEFLGVPL